MIQLQWLIDEFVGIMDFLMKQEKYRKYKGFLLIEKSDLESLLNQNRYETAYNKLTFWKRLHWIDAEPERLTKRIYDKSNEKQKRVVKIDIKVYEIMKLLNEKT